MWQRCEGSSGEKSREAGGKGSVREERRHRGKRSDLEAGKMEEEKGKDDEEE